MSWKVSEEIDSLAFPSIVEMAEENYYLEYRGSDETVTKLMVNVYVSWIGSRIFSMKGCKNRSDFNMACSNMGMANEELIDPIRISEKTIQRIVGFKKSKNVEKDMDKMIRALAETYITTDSCEEIGAVWPILKINKVEKEGKYNVYYLDHFIGGFHYIDWGHVLLFSEVEE